MSVLQTVSPLVSLHLSQAWRTQMHHRDSQTSFKVFISHNKVKWKSLVSEEAFLFRFLHFQCVWDHCHTRKWCLCQMFSRCYCMLYLTVFWQNIGLIFTVEQGNYVSRYVSIATSEILQCFLCTSNPRTIVSNQNNNEVFRQPFEEYTFFFVTGVTSTQLEAFLKQINPPKWAESPPAGHFKNAGLKLLLIYLCNGRHFFKPALDWLYRAQSYLIRLDFVLNFAMRRLFHTYMMYGVEFVALWRLYLIHCVNLLALIAFILKQV